MMILGQAAEYGLADINRVNPQKADQSMDDWVQDSSLTDSERQAPLFVSTSAITQFLEVGIFEMVLRIMSKSLVKLQSRITGPFLADIVCTCITPGTPCHT